MTDETPEPTPSQGESANGESKDRQADTFDGDRAPVTVGLHVGQLTQPIPGGIGRYVDALMHALPGHGAQLRTFASGSLDTTVLTAPLDPRVRHRDLGWPGPRWRYAAWHILRSRTSPVDAQVIHAPSLAIPPHRDRPLAVTVHDLVFLTRPETLTRRGRSFHMKGFELALREADAIITPTTIVADHLINLGIAPERVARVPHGIAPPLPPLDPKTERLALAEMQVPAEYILFVGTVEPRKGLPTMLKAFEAVRSQHPGLELVIAGPPGWGDTADLDRSGVRRVGKVTDQRLATLYRNARALVSLSLEEGFGFPVLEAQAYGCPALASAIPVHQEIAGPAALLVPPRQPDEAAEALLTLLEESSADNAARRALGIEHASGFTWEASARGHVDVYRRLAEERSGSL